MHGRAFDKRRLSGTARVLAVMASVGFAAATISAADVAPRPSPATRVSPATERANKIRVWFADLSNPDADLRDGARRKLLSLSRGDLTTLRDVVKQRLPLMPGESEVLRDIVSHVYLAGADTPAAVGSTAFVGVYFDGDQLLEGDYGGAEIRHRIPGASASRYLEDGDVVIGIGEIALEYPIRNTADFVRIVKDYRPGDLATFQLIRRGRVVRIPVVLGAHPRDLTDPIQIPEYVSSLLASATGYWEAAFQPMLDATAATASTK